MKKILICLCLALFALAGKAQTGLDGIYVEKYYVSNAADAAGSAGTLPAGSVTWRIYADMAPGYYLLQVYGIPTHPLTISTTTSFFNNTDYGAVTPGFSAGNAKKNTVMLDSWLSTGNACTSWLGVPKSEDNGVNNFVNANGLLKNADPSAGLPLTSQDGLMAGTNYDISIVGITTDAISDGSVTGNAISTNNGSWYSTQHPQGATASNRVLIGQFTTDGTLHYELNVEIGKDLGGGQSTAEYYVTSNPQAGEFSGAQYKLSGTLSAGNVKPTVSLTAPVNNAHSITGDVVALAATAADADGSVTKVEFFVDGVSVGVDVTAPYTANYNGVAGTHIITAVATDDANATTTSDPVTLTVGNHIAPNVSITAPLANAKSVVGDAVAIAATASGNDGSAITSVEFFVDGISVGIDNTAPYTGNYVGVLGTHNLTAKATDDRNLSTTSAAISIQVLNNTPPSVSITDPANNQSKSINTVVPISANASDVDGTVVKVEFFVNGIKIGEDATAPYSINWTPNAEGSAVLTAIATDNKGATSTSAAITVVVNDPNALPYQISNVVQTCLPSSVCIPVVSTKATMKNVTGYDVILNYDKTRVKPTGNITVSNDLINASATSVVTNIDTVNSLMNITIYFNSNAGAGTNFHGAGQVFCAEFVKTANFKSVDTAKFHISSLDESYTSGVLPKPVKDGMFITYKDSTFHGSLIFWYDNSPIKYDVAHPNDYLITNIFGCQKTTNAVQPDTLGNFVYNVWNGTSIEIKRDILNTTYLHSVLDADDALRAAKVAAKDTKYFTPSIYQMIAMDVNADGVISAGDASQISQRATGVIPEFTQVWNAGTTNPSKDWLFVNAVTLADPAYKISANYPANDGVGFSKYKVPVVSFCQSVPVADPTTCPFISNGGIYTGIMLGDVNATYASIPHDGLLKSAKATGVITLDLSKATLLKTGDISIPVSLSNAAEVTSFDFDLSVNDSKAVVKSVYNPNDLAGSVNYVDSIKRLAVSLYSMTTVPAKNAISIVLTPKSNETLVSSDFIAPVKYIKINGQQANLEVVAAPTGVNSLNVEEFKVYPNPASDKLNVEVSENSIVQMFDMNGKQIIETNINADQKQVIDVQNLANGVYMIQVSNNKFVKTQKVVISK